MPANQFGVDIGDMYRTVESIKGARLGNKLASMKIEDVKRNRVKSSAKARTNREHENLLATLKTQVQSPDKEESAKAFKLMSSIDTEAATQFQKFLSNASEEERKQAAIAAANVGKTSYAILSLNQQDPQAAQQMYSEMRNSSPEMQAKFPESLQDGAGLLHKGVALALPMETLAKNPDFTVTGDTIQQYQHGLKAGELDSGAKDKRQLEYDKMSSKERTEKLKASKGKGGLTEAQQATIKRNREKDVRTYAADLAKAERDPSGNLIIFKDNQAVWNTVQAVALKLMDNDPNLLAVDAVRQSAKELGVIGKKPIKGEEAKAAAESAVFKMAKDRWGVSSKAGGSAGVPKKNNSLAVDVKPSNSKVRKYNLKTGKFE